MARNGENTSVWNSTTPAAPVQPPKTRLSGTVTALFIYLLLARPRPRILSDDPSLACSQPIPLHVHPAVPHKHCPATAPYSAGSNPSGRLFVLVTAQRCAEGEAPRFGPFLSLLFIGKRSRFPKELPVARRLVRRSARAQADRLVACRRIW